MLLLLLLSVTGFEHHEDNKSIGKLTNFLISYNYCCCAADEKECWTSCKETFSFSLHQMKVQLEMNYDKSSQKVTVMIKYKFQSQPYIDLHKV